MQQVVHQLAQQQQITIDADSHVLLTEEGRLLASDTAAGDLQPQTLYLVPRDKTGAPTSMSQVEESIAAITKQVEALVKQQALLTETSRELKQQDVAQSPAKESRAQPKSGQWKPREQAQEAAAYWAQEEPKKTPQARAPIKVNRWRWLKRPEPATEEEQWNVINRARSLQHLRVGSQYHLQHTSQQRPKGFASLNPRANFEAHRMQTGLQHRLQHRI